MVWEPRPDEHFERAFGKPVDPDYWAVNNPASIVASPPDRLRDSGLQIYFEAGDEDQFWFYEGAEFLHQTLWNQKIKHEYHLVRGADHVGASARERTMEAYRFLARNLRRWLPVPMSEDLAARMKEIERIKSQLDEKDHYYIDRKVNR